MQEAVIFEVESQAIAEFCKGSLYAILGDNRKDLKSLCLVLGCRLCEHPTIVTEMFCPTKCDYRGQEGLVKFRGEIFKDDAGDSAGPG